MFFPLKRGEKVKNILHIIDISRLKEAPPMAMTLVVNWRSVSFTPIINLVFDYQCQLGTANDTGDQFTANVNNIVGQF